MGSIAVLRPAEVSLFSWPSGYLDGVAISLVGWTKGP